MTIASDIKRTAAVRWEGDFAEGKGTFGTGGGDVSATYTFGMRFSGEPGPNPEELLGASLASCFTMTFSAALTCADHAPTSIDTIATVSMAFADPDFTIAHIELETTAVVPGIDEAAFRELAESAKANCPIGKALASVPTTLKAVLKP